VKRYALSLAILVVGLFWVSVGAPVWGGQSLLERSKPVQPSSPTATPDSREKDAKVMAIVLQNKTIEGMLAGRVEGRDYWIRIGYTFEHAESVSTEENPIAMVHFYFDPPVSYAGEFPVIVSDPCSGHYGEDERLDPDDPCMKEPKEYGSALGALVDAQGIVAQVDLRRGELVEVFQPPVAVEEMQDIRRRYGQ
jgi:hypothetical protein